MTDSTPIHAQLKAPKGLAATGRRLWKSIAARYILRPDEVVLLETACKTADFIAQLDAELVGAPLTTKGSMGQEREHPLLSERRQQSAHLAALLKQLKLPDTSGQTGADRRTAQARKAALARWAR